MALWRFNLGYWRSFGLARLDGETVEAYTKSEARVKFKTLSGIPKLPPGGKIECVKGAPATKDKK